MGAQLQIMSRSPNWFLPWWDSAYYAASVALGITSLAWIVGGTFSSNDFPDQKVSNETDEYTDAKADGHTGPYYVFVLTSCGLVFHRLYVQLFFQSHLVRILSSIVDQLTDIHQFRNTENSIVFTNALHRSEKSSFLLKVFLTTMVGRGFLTIVSSIFVIHSSSPPVGQSQAKFTLYLFLWSLTIGLLCLQLAALISGVFWYFLSRSYTFSRLMTHYSLFLGKVDVARGRSVPSPVDNHRPYQVLPALNPYSSSKDLCLLLDLLATKAGTGIALRCLAGLETDLADSWAPTGVQLETEEGSLVVYWKDPIVMSYMPSCVVKVHYGVEVEIPGYKTQTRIISHEEVRFMKQTWRANHPSAVELGADDDFIYHENFSGLSVLFPCTVQVWTIVNGQLISSTERRIIGNELFQDILPTGSSTPRFSIAESNCNDSNDNITRLNVEYTDQECIRSRDGSLISSASTQNKSMKSNSVNFLEKNNSIELVRSSKESFATMGSGIEEVNNKKLMESPTIRLSVKSSSVKPTDTNHANGKAVSETNLTFPGKSDAMREAFSRKANNRKSLPAGHMNMAFITDDDGKDPFLLI